MVWYVGQTAKGNKKFTRKYNGKYLNITLLKNNHVFITFDAKPITDSDLHYENDEQIQKDTEQFINEYIEPEIKAKKKQWVKLANKQQTENS